MGQLTDRHCHNLPSGTSHKLLALKSCLWRHQTKSHRPWGKHSLTTAALADVHTTAKGQPWPSWYPKAILPSWCLSEQLQCNSPTHDWNLSEETRRWWGWDFSDNLTQLIKSGLRLQEYLLQPPANRDHPLWSSGTVCPSLVCTMPGLPWSTIARHVSCCYLWSLLCLPRREPQEQLPLSQVTWVNCSFFLSPWLSPWPLSPLHGFAVAPTFLLPSRMEPGDRTWGRKDSVRRLSLSYSCSRV